MSDSPAELFLKKHGRKWRSALDKQFTQEDQNLLNHQWRGWWARPEQLPPDGDWFVWALQGGRGSGKTRGASECVQEWALALPGSRGALVGATPGDARDVMVEGQSGVLNTGHVDERPIYEPSKRLVIWPNGTRATVYSAFDPGHIHGPEHHWAWCDGLEVWKAPKSEELDPWRSLVMGLRLGDHPRVVCSMVPRATALIKKILAREDAVLARMSTYDNLSNLPQVYVDEILNVYKGTTFGRTFIDGYMLEDVEGALWKQRVIDASRIATYPPLKRIYVGVDPPGGVTECGIVTVGVDQYEEIFCLEDASLQAHPQIWAKEAILQCQKYQADAIVAEKNFGGDMVKNTIQQVAFDMQEKGEIDSAPHIIDVSASRGKYIRAEPAAALHEQGRAHMVGNQFEQLENEMTTYVPGEASPNRLDAYVWAVSKCVKARSAIMAAWV